MSGFKVSKGKGLRQANRQLESMGCITQLQHHPHLGFSLHIRLTFMEHKFGHSDTLECCFLGHISHFRVLFLLLPISPPRRYVYVPNEENSSKSLEMERIMREARLWLFSFFVSWRSFSIFCQDERALQGTLQLHLRRLNQLKGETIHSESQKLFYL